MNHLYALIYPEQATDDPCEIAILGISADKRRLKREMDRLCEPYEQTLAANRKHDLTMKALMRGYLEANRPAIDDFKHRGFGHKQGDALREEQDGVITFLVNNWTYSLGDEGFIGENSFVAAYCDVNRLSRPFPELTYFKADPMTKGRTYVRELMSIVKGPVL